MEKVKKLAQLIVNNKGVKTSIIAVIAIVLGVAVFVLFFFDKIDKDDLTIAIAGLGAFTAILGGLFAKDVDKSHTIN